MFLVQIGATKKCYKQWLPFVQLSLLLRARVEKYPVFFEKTTHLGFPCFFNPFYGFFKEQVFVL